MTNELRELRQFFGLTLALSWAVPGLGLLIGLPLKAGGLLFAFATCGPSLAALILHARARSLRCLLRSLARPTTWLAALSACLLLPALAVTLHLLSGSGPLRPWTLSLLKDPAPLGEELGWRGYALPRLLKLTSPLGATLILSIAWVVWHVPAFFVANVMITDISAFGWWAMGTLALCALMTWLYLIGGRNIVVAGVIPHASINMLGAVGLWSASPVQSISLLSIGLLLLLSNSKIRRAD